MVRFASILDPAPTTSPLMSAVVDFFATALGLINELQTWIQLLGLALILVLFVVCIVLFRTNPADPGQRRFATTVISLVLGAFFLLVVTAMGVEALGARKAVEIENQIESSELVRALTERPLDIYPSRSPPETGAQLAMALRQSNLDLNSLVGPARFFTKAGADGFGEVSSKLGRLAYFADMYDQARELLGNSFEFKATPQVLNDLGVVSYKKLEKTAGGPARKQELEKAQEYFQRALGLDAEFVPAINNLGLLSYAETEFHRAIDHYNTALAIDPEYENALNNRGLAYRSLAKNEGAEKRAELFKLAQADFDLALALNSESPEINYNRGLLATDLEDREAEILYYGKAVQQDSWDRRKRAIALNNLSWRLSRRGNKGDFDEAVKLGEQAVELEPKEACFWDTLARAYLAAGDCKDGMRTIERAASLAAEDDAGCAVEIQTSKDLIAAKCAEPGS